jgi:hypothetical protein
MTTSITELDSKIAAQAAQIPSMYGRIDLSATPERFTVALGDQTDLASEYAARRLELLANEALVARIKAYTMIGDIVADAYAALTPTYGFQRLVTMLTEACDRGVENVPCAPPELARFIAAMERLPDWLDRNLIEEVARVERNAHAHRAPFVIRGRSRRHLHEQIFRAADGAHRRLVERILGTPDEGDGDVLHHHRDARRSRPLRRWLQGRGDGAPDACDGAVQYLAARRPMGRENLRHPDSPGGPDAGGNDLDLSAGAKGAA